MIFIIACIDSNNGIGKNGKIPWRLPPDLKYFKCMTTNSVVLMGRKTFESMHRNPLPNRINIVLSKCKYSNIITFDNFDDAITEAKKHKKPIYIIGGASLYKYALPIIDTAYITEIEQDFKCDTFFPIELNSLNKTQGDLKKYKDIAYRFNIYQRYI